MADLEDIRRKRRRVFSSASNTPVARNSGVIDLTGDSPEPDNGKLTHTGASTFAPSADSDEALARKLQAQFDLENTQPHASSSTAPAIPFLSDFDNDDEAFARKLQAQYNDENQQMIYRSTEDQPETINHDWSRGAHDSQVHSGKMSLPARTLHDTATPASPSAQTISEPQLQAQEVQMTIRELIQPISKTKCGQCNKHILKTESDISALGRQLQSRDSLLSIPKGIQCPSCGATNEHEKDRLLYIWALLCDFDTRSKHNKPDKKKRSKATKKTSGNGTGYGGNSRRGHAGHDDEWATFSSPAAIYNESYGKAGRPNTTTGYGHSAPHKLDGDDAMTIEVFNCLINVLPNFEKESPFDFDPPTKQLQSLFLCSSVLERAAELLRNNDLDNVIGNKKLYESLASFVKTLASHPSTSSLVFRERVIRTPGVNILKVSHGKADLSSTGETDTTQPLVHCIRELAVQCSTMLRTSGYGSGEMRLFREIKNLNDFLVVNGGSQKKPAVGKNAWHKELAVSEVPDEAVLECHSLVGKSPASSEQPNRMKRIMREVARLSAGLPDGIFVRYADSRPDVMKALIIGPKDTPYENGLFEFDILCDSSFPVGPPKVQFRTTGGGTVGFNPNLYADGKVCLSLLGTWAGEPWDPKRSTLLQVLVSIQAMIFCDRPWQNEPGRENMSNADEMSQNYNRFLFQHTVQLAMLDWLERRRYPFDPRMLHSRPPGRFGTQSLPDTSAVDSSASIWDEITKRHFDDNAEEIVSTVSKWVQDVISTRPPRPPGLGYDWGAANTASPFGGMGNTLGSSNSPGPKSGPPQGSVPPTPPGMAARLGNYPDPIGGHSWMLGATYPHSYDASPSHLPGIPQMNDRALFSKPIWGGGSNSINTTTTPVTSGQTLSSNPTPGTTVTTLEGDSLPQKLRSAAQKLKSNSRGQMPFY